MKTDIKHEGIWWSYISTCDRCGKLRYDHDWEHGNEPNTEEVDFCVNCLTYLLDNNIPYKTAKQEYKK